MGRVRSKVAPTDSRLSVGDRKRNNLPKPKHLKSVQRDMIAIDLEP